MKNILNLRFSFIYPILAGSLALGACGQKVLDFRNAEIANGKIYRSGADKPFSGQLTNLPDRQLLLSQNGFRSFSQVIINTQKEGAAFSNLGLSPSLGLLSGSLCDVRIEDGAPDGKATCKVQRSDTLTFEMAFRNGALSGDLKYYGKGGNIVSEVSFKDGAPDGKQTIRGDKTGNPIYVVNWENGALNGWEEAYDENTGGRVFKVNMADGKRDGDYMHYAPDGDRIIRKLKFSHGLQEGSDDSYDPQTGKQTGHAEWSNGKLNGPFKQWGADGNLTKDTVYKNNIEVISTVVAQSEDRTSFPTFNACMEIWQKVYQKENGPDALVTYDQAWVWKDACDAGKRPS